MPYLILIFIFDFITYKALKVPALHIANSEFITWSYEGLNVAIPGGIKPGGLDRLRVTLKIDHKGQTIRDGVDLYNDQQTEKMIRKISERFGIGSAYIGKMLNELTNELEAYRIKEITAKQDKEPTQYKPLTEGEREAAKTLLKHPDLLAHINDLIGQSGVVGEEQNRLLMYIVFSSRKREYPLHIVSLAASGIGKSYLQESVAALIPEQDKKEMTAVSENALYYFGQYELQNKLLLIEDLDGAQNVLYPIRELQSKRKISKTVTQKDSQGNLSTQTLTVEGPVSVSGCTTQENIYEDNANRTIMIFLDNSKEQDERIMARQRLMSAGLIDTAKERHIKTLLQHAQRVLEPITVRNPFAPLLCLPPEVFKPRRTNKHYLDFIEAITFLKQHQRQHKADHDTGEIFIETTLEDIKEANTLMAPVLLRKSDPLNGATRDHLERLKNYLQTQGEQSDSGFTSKDICKAFHIPLTTVKRYHLQLVENSFLRKIKNKDDNDRHSKSYRYQVISPTEYSELKSSVQNALDAVLERIRQQLSGENVDRLPPNGPVSAQSGSGPMKSNTAKDFNQQPTKPTQKTPTPKKSTFKTRKNKP